MIAEDFAKVFEDQMKYCESLLVNKATEYASVDRLSAFKEAAAIQGTTAKQALAGMMAKHTQSIYKFCRDEKSQPQDKWIEKITDHINYLILLRALVVEENWVKATAAAFASAIWPADPAHPEAAEQEPADDTAEKKKRGLNAEVAQGQQGPG